MVVQTLVYIIMFMTEQKITKKQDIGMKEGVLQVGNLVVKN